MPIRTRSSGKSKARFSWGKGLVWAYFTLLLLFVCLAVFLLKSGKLLVAKNQGEDPVKWAVVLAGEEKDMERTQEAWTLFQEGRFENLILSGPRVFRTHHESEFSAEFLVSKGFPKDRIFQLPNEATSTAEEAVVLMQQARLLEIDTLLIITSDFHSARAQRIFNKLSGGNPVIRFHGATTNYFDAKAWWSSRQSTETWVIEWIKTLASAMETARSKPLEGMAELVLLEPNPLQGDVAEKKVVKEEGSATMAVKDSSKVAKDSVKNTPLKDSTISSRDSQ